MEFDKWMNTRPPGWKLPQTVEAFMRESWDAGVAHEREACALVCDKIIDRRSVMAEQSDNEETIQFYEAEACGAEDCAESIRARK